MPVVEPVRATFGLGIDNRSRLTSLRTSDGVSALRDAVNVEIDRAGNVQRRKGARLLTALASVHSLWSHPNIAYGLVAAEGSLHRVQADGSVTDLGVTCTAHGRVAYAEMDGSVYWSDGSYNGVVTDDATRSWGLSVPSSPLVSAYSSGGLPPAEYAVAVTVLAPDGQESGAQSSSIVSLAALGGIQVSGLPALEVGWRYSIYLTHPDGIDPYHYADVAANGATVYLTHPPTGDHLRTQYLSPPPVASVLAAYHGRIYLSTGSTVWFTADESPLLHRPDSDFFLFPQPVRMLAPTEDGLYVGTSERVYFLAGSDASQFRQRLAHQRGVVAGAYGEVPAEFFGGNSGGWATAWRDTAGVLCVGRPDGVVQRIAEERVVTGEYGQGSLTWRETDGQRQVFNVLYQPAGNNDVAFGDRWDAVVRRNGLSLDGAT